MIEWLLALRILAVVPWPDPSIHVGIGWTGLAGPMFVCVGRDRHTVCEQTNRNGTHGPIADFVQVGGHPMTAEDAAREFLRLLNRGTFDDDDIDSLTALILARERAARVEALREAADRLRRTGGPWFEGIPDSDRDAAYADWLAARAEEEDRG